MMSSRNDRYYGLPTYFNEELEQTKKEIPQYQLNRMSFLERKQIKDHQQDKFKIKTKREKLRKKRKNKK